MLINNNEKNHCLVIIDMQWEFLQQIKKTQNINLLIENIIKKINYFKKHNLPIVIVEYIFNDNNSNKNIRNLYTAKKILKEVVHYDKLYYTTKTDDSGAVEIVDVLSGKNNHIIIYDAIYQSFFINKLYKPIYSNYPQWNFYLTGVNASACVLYTGFDLYKMFNHKSYISMFCSYDTFSDEWSYQCTIFEDEYIKNAIELVA